MCASFATHAPFTLAVIQQSIVQGQGPAGGMAGVPGKRPQVGQ